MNAHMEEGDHHQYICCSFWWTPATIMLQMPAHSILTYPYPSQKNSSRNGFTYFLICQPKVTPHSLAEATGGQEMAMKCEVSFAGQKILKIWGKKGGITRGRRKKKHPSRIQSFLYKVRNRTAIEISPTKQQKFRWPSGHRALALKAGPVLFSYPILKLPADCAAVPKVITREWLWHWCRLHMKITVEIRRGGKWRKDNRCCSQHPGDLQKCNTVQKIHIKAQTKKLLSLTLKSGGSC